MVFWRLERHRKLSDGDFLRAFEDLAKNPDAFAHAIEYIKPKPWEHGGGDPRRLPGMSCAVARFFAD